MCTSRIYLEMPESPRIELSRYGGMIQRSSVGNYVDISGTRRITTNLTTSYPTRHRHQHQGRRQQTCGNHRSSQRPAQNHVATDHLQEYGQRIGIVQVHAQSAASPSSESSPPVAEELDAGGAAELPDGAEPLARGCCVMSTSCWPSGMGPLGLAGHEAAGLTGALRPKGMVPGLPTLTPPTKVSWEALWNWHWKRPWSSAFFGAFWQYCTACEVG